MDTPPEEAAMPDENVTLEFSRAEAIVLYEFTSRFSDTDRLTVDDQAEARVLWDICCMLERALWEPIGPGYAERLEKARDSVRDVVE